MTKQTILVTGGAGYIGSHTIIELLANDKYEVISVDCFFNSSPKAYTQIEQITGKKFKIYNIDLCDEKAFDNIFTENKIKKQNGNIAPYNSLGRPSALHFDITL